MLNTEFYTKLDGELSELIAENSSNAGLKHKNKEQNKPYAFLMWFLKFYGQTQVYSQYITEGNDDASCDIILDVDDVEKGKIFYVIQSKWNNKQNASKQINSTEFKSALDDFKLVLLGEKGKTKNDNFNKKYKELTKHAQQNGTIKFVYFSLCNANPEVDDNIASFEKNYATSVEVLDINRIKRDYIDFHYKKIIPDNPLEQEYSPDEEIRLNIDQLDIKQNYLKINSPFSAYIFLLRPKTIFELFEKYKFKLFFKNVRNPLIHSKVNENIEETLKNEIPYFWYFNNGITALTSGVDGHINPTAKSIKVSGLQIINGAQTVYSVYKSYRDASAKDRRIMDKEALLTMRLLTVNSKELGLKITRYTNSQNPMEERDFWANDDVQVALQQQSFNTKYWYEKRRGEFREVPEGITPVSNRDFAMYHLIFNLEKPVEAQQAMRSDKDYFFISRKDDKDGLYEEIFLENPVRFDDMLAAYLFCEAIHANITAEINDEAATTLTFFFFTLAKTLLKKYLFWKYKSKSINLTEFIIEKHSDDNLLFAKVIEFTIQESFLYLDISNNINMNKHDDEKFYTLLTREIKQEVAKEHFEQFIIDDEKGQAIENWKLKFIKANEKSS